MMTLFDVAEQHGARHAHEIAFLAPKMRQMAYEAGPDGVTVQEFKVRAQREGWMAHLGLKQRALSYLGQLGRAAGLIATSGMRTLTSRNRAVVWVHPDHV